MSLFVENVHKLYGQYLIKMCGHYYFISAIKVTRFCIVGTHIEQLHTAIMLRQGAMHYS